MSGFLGFVLGALVGALLGVVATVTLQAPMERAYAAARHRVRRRHSRGSGASDDLLEIGLVEALSWSATRPLDPRLHQVLVDDSPVLPQDWFDEPVWDESQRVAREQISGRVAWLRSIDVDSGEAGPQSRGFTMRVGTADYSDSIAAQTLCAQPQLAARPLAKLVSGFEGALKTGPPQSFFVALTVSTRAGDVLASRRSFAGVATAAGLWSLAFCETMAAPSTSPGVPPEDLFDLAKRAALEEVGLPPHELGPMWFSWFGFATPDGPLAIAHVETSLSPEEVVARARDAEGGYESSALRWIPAASAEIKQLALAEVRPEWVRFNPAVARGLLRMAGHLDLDPRRR